MDNFENYYTYQIDLVGQEVRARSYEPSSSIIKELSSNVRLGNEKSYMDELGSKIKRSKPGHRKIAMMGECLYRSLFTGEIDTHFRDLLSKVSDEDAYLRLELDLDEINQPEVSILPWELLRTPDIAGRPTDSLATHSQVILSRRRRLLEPIKPIIADEPIKVQLVVAAPEAEDPVEYKDVEQALQNLSNKNPNLFASFLPTLYQPDFTAIDEMLRNVRPHILHFIGHGRFRQIRNCRYGEIAIIGKDGRTAEWLLDTEFGALFQRFRPRVVILQVCESAKRDNESTFIGIASQIVQRNVPAVIAMQFPISNIAAVEFANAFYTRVGELFPIDIAVQEGRRTLGQKYRHTRDFASPVLYLRVLKGRVFERSIQDFEKREESDLQAYEDAYLNKLMQDYEDYQTYSSIYIPLRGLKPESIGNAQRLSSAAIKLLKPILERWEDETRQKRIHVEDIREAIYDLRRVILLGAPGSGKTTTLMNLMVRYIDSYRKNRESQKLPAYIKLSGYVKNEDFGDFVRSQFGPMSLQINGYFQQGKVILLLDGLNELPRDTYNQRVASISSFLESVPNIDVMIACREIDYPHKALPLKEIYVLPFDVLRIWKFLHAYLGNHSEARSMFWALTGEYGSTMCQIAQVLEKNKYKQEDIWTLERLPFEVEREITPQQDLIWKKVRSMYPKLPSMMELLRSPFMLARAVVAYIMGGKLFQTRGKLFDFLVKEAVSRAQEIAKTRNIPILTSTEFVNSLATIAYTMQSMKSIGTAVERDQAESWIEASTVKPNIIFHYGTSSGLLNVGEQVQFTHHFIQEYFAAVELNRRIDQKEVLAADLWPKQWWVPTGWEETVIWATSLHDVPLLVVKWIVETNPVLAWRCISESGTGITVENTPTEVIDQLRNKLVEVCQDIRVAPLGRALAGRALAGVGDPRVGVGLDKSGGPEINWIRIPGGLFIMGVNLDDTFYFNPPLQEDKRSTYFAPEMPRHTCELEEYWISKYTITNIQFNAFVDDGGYTEKQRECWTDEGWEWLIDHGLKEPKEHGFPYNLSNHPRVGITWYEIIAFCNWLTKKYRKLKKIREDQMILPPSEAQWEKAARGEDGLLYPWGNEYDCKKANNREIGVNSLAAVGLFLNGASVYGVYDMSGNIWEWTRTIWGPDANKCAFMYPYDADDGREDISALASVRRVQRGGSFTNTHRVMRPTKRDWGYPISWLVNDGFRVVIDSLERIEKRIGSYKLEQFKSIGLNIVAQIKEQVMVIEASGRLDEMEESKLEQAFNNLLKRGNYQIVVNLKKLEYLSAGGIQILYRTMKRVRRMKGDIRLVVGDDRINEALRVSGVLQQFRYYLNPGDAIVSFC